MNLNKRYQGKRPALLIVPAGSKSKRGWINALNIKFKYSDDYIFRVFTSEADLPRQLRKMSSRFSNIFFINNPLDNYAELMKIAEQKSAIIQGLHIFRHRQIVAIQSFQLNTWNMIIKDILLNEERPN